MTWPGNWSTVAHLRSDVFWTLQGNANAAGPSLNLDGLLSARMFC